MVVGWQVPAALAVPGGRAAGLRVGHGVRDVAAGARAPVLGGAQHAAAAARGRLPHGRRGRQPPRHPPGEHRRLGYYPSIVLHWVRVYAKHCITVNFTIYFNWS